MTAKLAPLKSIVAVVNSASGGVGPGAAQALRILVEGLGFEVTVHAPPPAGLSKALKKAVAAGPDLLIVLAGDGTARAAACLCGPKGPLLAPLPGGTMNVLPRALYGDRDWRTALTDILTHGDVRVVPGGEIKGQAFFVAAMLGSPALWAHVREAARGRQALEMLRHARRAWSRAFSGRLRFSLDGGETHKAEVLSLVCPLVSTHLDDDALVLEAAAFTPSGPGEALRIGFRAALSDIFGDWRDDPAVEIGVCRRFRAWGRGSIPILLDGEPVRLAGPLEGGIVKAGFRALVPAA